MTVRATCRCSPEFSPINSRRSFATERMARASLSWRAGGCPVHRSSAVHRSPIFAMLAARTGAAGSASKTAASCRQPRSASTRTQSLARPRSGSPSARTAPCLPSLVYGPLGAVCEGQRARRGMRSTSCSAFSRQSGCVPRQAFRGRHGV
jgi:hypothetical protein